MEFFVAFLMAACFILGNSIGSDTGKSSLCKKQFAGEMHGGKCVKVQREEVK